MPIQDLTLTMYFCGSGNNMSEYKSNKHAVPKLISLARNRHIGFDGPGGNPNNKAVYRMNSNGTFYQDNNGNKVLTRHGNKIKAKWYNMATKKHSAFGNGTNANVTAAIDWLMVQFANWDQRPIANINLCGHSRGSVTATVVAWAINYLIKPEFPALKVNMFLFDPVAGAQNEFKDVYAYDDEKFPANIDKLPPCVTSFCGLMAANMDGTITGGMAKDNGFQSTMPARNLCLDYSVYVMPGGHNGATKYNLNDGGSQIGRLGMHLAMSYLKEKGSQFSGDMTLTQAQVLEAYAIARNPNRGVRAKHGSLDNVDLDQQFFGDDNSALSTPNRVGLTSKFSLSYGHDVFVNDHHMGIFQRMFPMIAAKLWIGNIDLNDLNQITPTCPETAYLLRILGKVTHRSTRKFARV